MKQKFLFSTDLAWCFDTSLAVTFEEGDRTVLKSNRDFFVIEECAVGFVITIDLPSKIKNVYLQSMRCSGQQLKEIDE